MYTELTNHNMEDRKEEETSNNDTFDPWAPQPVRSSTMPQPPQDPRYVMQSSESYIASLGTIFT